QHESLRIGKAADFANAIQILVCGDFLMAVAGHYRLIVCRFAGKSIASAPPLGRMFLVVTRALPKTLDETDGRSEEIEMATQPIFQEELVAEMQPLALVREENKSGRRSRRLCHVVDLHAMGRGRSSPRQIDARQPAVQFPRGYSPLARLSDAIDESIEFFDVFAAQSGNKENWRIGQKLKLLAYQDFVFRGERRRIGRELLRISSLSLPRPLSTLLRGLLGG